MEVVETEVKLYPRYMRPQELEKDPLSGKTVTVRSQTGGGLGWRGKWYGPGKDGLIKRVPIEAIQEIEGAVYWRQGQPSMVKFEIVPA